MVRKWRPTPWLRSLSRGELAHLYSHAGKRDAEIDKSMTLDEARRVAANIAKLPNYLAANPESTA
jgi:hypothetical protein